MRHQRNGKKLGRDWAHRKALYSNLAGALIEHGRIRTTVTKAKAVKPLAEQMITLGRRGDLHARRQAVAFLRSKDVVHKLFSEVGPSFAARPGGYTRIIRIGPRAGDAAEMAYLELVDSPLVPKTRAPRGEQDVVSGGPQESSEPATPELAADAAVDDDEALLVESDDDALPEVDVDGEEHAVGAAEPDAESSASADDSV
jgi:large subunit ribosomal protein L17